MGSQIGSHMEPFREPQDFQALVAAISTSFERGGKETDGQRCSGRPHQVDAVARLVSALHRDCHAPAATNYLLQHSAGSGKSLTIAAACVALLRLTDAAGRRFHTVLVVNDRLQLDEQLGDTITAFAAGNGLPASSVARASSSSQLRSFLTAPLDGPTRPAIIMTTVQKLSSLWRAAAAGSSATSSAQPPPAAAAAAGVASGSSGGSGNSMLELLAANGRVALIADEAHRHHGSSTSEQISSILAAAFSGNDAQQQQQQQQQLALCGTSRQAALTGRGKGGASSRTAAVLVPQPRFVTFIGFSATPGARSLQLFGVARPVQLDALGNITMADDAPVGAADADTAADAADAAAAVGVPATLYAPFHCYSLQQATQDGYVLDVLQRFVSVTPRFQIAGLQLTRQQRQQLISLDQATGGAAAAAAAAAGSGGSGGPVQQATSGSSISQPSMAEELLVQAASNSRQLVVAKAEEVARRFLQAWGEAASCGFVGFRAMLVVRSRQHVVWYCQELRRLLAQHQGRLGELLAAAGEPEDAAAAAAAAAGDASRLVYGAFSGSIAVPADEAQQLWDGRRTAAAAATGTTRARQKRSSSAAADCGAAAAGGDGDSKPAQRKRQKQTSGWDAALAAFDRGLAAAQQQHEQQVEPQQPQQQQNGKSRRSLAAGSRQSSRQGASSSRPPSWGGSDSSESESERDESESAAGQEGESDDGSSLSGSDSDSNRQSHDGSASDLGLGSSSPGRAGSAGPYTTANGSSQQPLPQQQQCSRKRPRRDDSMLSCNTATAAAGDDEEGGPAVAAAAGSEADTQQQDSEQQEVSVSERELNAPGLLPRQARLLVVCSKFETGYDDPRLGALFIDRVVSGARAVQVLGRVNRPAPCKGSSSSSTSACDAASAAGAAGAADDGGGSATEGTAGAAKSAAKSVLASERSRRGFEVQVVDFVNSVGAIREAFSEFFGQTTYCTGSQAKLRRQQLALDECLGRLLEVLQPAAARAAAAAALARRLKQQQQQQQQQQRRRPDGPNQSGGAAAAAAGVAAVDSSSLADLNVSGVLRLVGKLSPEVQRAVEDDLSSYCSLCNRLRVEKLELPLAFAAALLAQLTARRQQRDKEAASGRFAWMQRLTAAAAAAAAADEHQAAPAAAACAASADEPAAAAAAAASGAAAATQPAARRRQQLQVSVRVCQLEETFAGRIQLQDSSSSAPLLSWRLASTNTSRSAAGPAAQSPESCVTAGRPLSEVIAAANALLAGRYKRQVASGLTELCERLTAAGDGSGNRRGTQTQPVAAAAAAASAAGGRLPGPSQGQAQAADAGSASSGVSKKQEEGDAYSIICLLRRLALWPVTAELLRATAAGKRVAALKQHPHPLVSSLAAQVVGEWRQAIARQQQAAASEAAAAAAKAQAEAGTPQQASASAAAAGGVDQGLRRRVVKQMRDALQEHIRAAAAATAGAAGAAAEQQVAASQEQQSRLQLLAEELEAELMRFAAGAGGSSSYKSRARMLCTGLRHADGIAAELLSGTRAASEVVGLDALSLAPAAVQQEVRRRREQVAREEAVWEALMATSVGGGGTHVSTEAACPTCGERRATVKTVLSGGTYAQERVQIQKYVCQECNYTWRSDE